MCVVSMITDYYREKWEPLVPVVPSYPVLPYTPWGGGGVTPQWIPPSPIPMPTVSKEEIEEFKRLLERAREYDARNNEPACELQEKKDALLKIAKALGIEIDFL